MNQLAKQEKPLGDAIEQVLIKGDLNTLTPVQRVEYYNGVCRSVGLNPLTRPFDYLQLNGKLILYARRDAADQLRSIHGVSLSKPHIEYTDDLVIVSIDAADKYGRTDADFGAVNLANLKGEAKANAIMKAITKAKRRVTLSICGLGWLDETEVETIPGAQRVVVAETGEIVDSLPVATDEIFEVNTTELGKHRTKFHELGREVFGENWPVARKRNVSKITGGATYDADALTVEQLQTLIAGMETLKRQRIEQQAEKVQRDAELREAA